MHIPTVNWGQAAVTEWSGSRTMMRRYRGWSSTEEHFRYDGATRQFVSDSNDSPKNSDDVEELGSPHLSATIIRYLEALAELRREFARYPADEWESGQLLKLYGIAIEAAAAADPVQEALSSARKVTDKKFGRSLLQFTVQADHKLRMFCRGLEQFFEQITHLSEIVIERHWPEAPSKIDALVSGKKSGKVDLLNSALNELNLIGQPFIQAIIDVWLSGFERPALYSQRRLVEDAILNGSYCIEKQTNYDCKFRLRNVAERTRSAVQFFEACQVVLRHTLSDAGQAVQNMTVAMGKA